MPRYYIHHSRIYSAFSAVATHSPSVAKNQNGSTSGWNSTVPVDMQTARRSLQFYPFDALFLFQEQVFVVVQHLQIL